MKLYSFRVLDSNHTAERKSKKTALKTTGMELDLSLKCKADILIFSLNVSCPIQLFLLELK